VQDKITKCLGLITQFNPLSVASGALRVADNCYIRRENIIEDRRGYKDYASFADNVKQLLTYQNRVLVHHGSKIAYDDGAGTFTDYTGSYTEPTNSRIRGLEGFSNLYATTSAGVKVFSDITGTEARLAGAPRALDPSFSLSGTSGFLDDGHQCAYRALIQRTDNNSNVIRGYPSQRLWVTNGSGNAANVALTIYIPSESVAGDIVQFYRTEQVSGTSDDTAGDEMGLVYQYELTSADITAGFISFTDSVTDELRGASLYTNPSQEGIQQANDRPPVCKDMALYKSNYMLFANTETKQRLFITLVGTADLAGKYLTIDGVNYEFSTSSEIISGAGSPQVLVSTSGVAAVDIDLTARSLVRVINRYAGNTSVYAYYLTGPGDLPGQILIEERGLGGAAFSVAAEDSSIAPMFFPEPPVSPATNPKSTSSNSVQKNAVFYSKSQQPEAVPALNYLLVGSANKAILRIIALRDSAIVIKEEGVYRITGETPQSFTVVPVDLTVFCKSADSVAALANQVFMLSNQGVVAISESGVQVISREIEPELTKLLTNANLGQLTTGVSYESERSYFISTITHPSDQAANQTFVYNVFTRTWVRHTYAFNAAIIEQSVDKLYFAKPASDLLHIERKDFADTDFQDPEIDITILSINGLTIEFSVSGVTPEDGWVVEQGSTFINIASVTPITGAFRCVLASEPPAAWTPGPAQIFPSVGMDIQYHSWTGQNPDVLKQVRQVGIFADDTPGTNSVTALTATFETNFDAENEEVDIDQPSGGWGSSWGSTPWGGGGDPAGYTCWVPRNKQYCTRMALGIRHKNAREKLSVAGVGFVFEAASDRIGR
jgi:hypothetical protein